MSNIWRFQTLFFVWFFWSNKTSIFFLILLSGKRGKKQLVGVVDISEIVSRIAPKVSNSLLRSDAQTINRFLFTFLLFCPSEARQTEGCGADLTAVDRRQRHHSLHARRSGSQTQEEIPEVGSEDKSASCWHHSAVLCRHHGRRDVEICVSVCLGNVLHM